MPSIKNTNHIDSVVYGPASATCFCPMGQAWCTYDFIISFIPNELIPDYLDIDAVIQEMNQKQYTVEDAVAHVFGKMEWLCQPKELTVQLSCNDAKHAPVIVTKVLNGENKGGAVR